MKAVVSSPLPVSRCHHVNSIGQISLSLVEKQCQIHCAICDYSGNSRWLCLGTKEDPCLKVFCGEKAQNHGSCHCDAANGHFLALHATRWRIWCHECQSEVYPDRNIPGWKLGDQMARRKMAKALASQKESAKSRVKLSMSSASGDDELIDNSDVVSAACTPCTHRKQMTDSVTGEACLPDDIPASVQPINRSLVGDGHDLVESGSMPTNLELYAGDAGRRPMLPKRQRYSLDQIVVAPDSIHCELTPGDREISDWQNRQTGKENQHHGPVTSFTESDSGIASSASTILADSEYAAAATLFLFNAGRPYRDRDCPMATGNNNSDTGNFYSGEETRGLTGLRNLGNTCYMNAALQALSHCEPLTEFMRQCEIRGAEAEVGGGTPCCAAGLPELRSETARSSLNLAHAFQKLIKELWSEKRPSHVIPIGVLGEVRHVFPLFRGFAQQDSQEFLRCLMDQLHEELKQPVYAWESRTDQLEMEERQRMSTSLSSIEDNVAQGQLSPEEEGLSTSPSSTSGEDNYTTCDSGWSSEKEMCSTDVRRRRSIRSRKRQRGTTVPGLRAELDNRTSLVDHGAGLGDRFYNQLTIDPKQNTRSARAHVTKSVSSKTMDCSDEDEDDDCTDVYGENNSDLAHLIASTDGMSGEVGDVGRRGKAIPAKRLRSGRQIATSCPQRLPRFPEQKPQLHKPKKVQHKIIYKKTPVDYRSVVSDIFDGKILSSVQCLACNRVSKTKETFQDLSLPIPTRDQLEKLHGYSYAQDSTQDEGWISWLLGFGWLRNWVYGPEIRLEDCLSAFFSKDDLKGDDMYSCENCKKLRNGVKYCSLYKLPEVLCIHLKRFRHDFTFSSKLSHCVTFPLEGLNLRRFMHQDSAEEEKKCDYDLFAVICHHGSAGGGHYTAYCLNYLNHRWYEFDDQCVTEVDPYVVQNAEAYVLFYRKSPLRAEKIREHTIEILNREHRKGNLMKFYLSREWVNRFNTFADPGPITNYDFLCPHGCIPPTKAAHVSELYAEVPANVWKYLYAMFGGGPVCSHLYHCLTCQRELVRLNVRRKKEFDFFVTAEQEFRRQRNPGVHYAIALRWFTKWEEFVLNKRYEPPGSVDNTSIILKRNEKLILKPSPDFAFISRDLWEFFFSTYGGGPEVEFRPGSGGTLTHVINLEPEVGRIRLVTPSASPRGVLSRMPIPIVHSPSPVASDANDVDVEMRKEHAKYDGDENSSKGLDITDVGEEESPPPCDAVAITPMDCNLDSSSQVQHSNGIHNNDVDAFAVSHNSITTESGCNSNAKTLDQAWHVNPTAMAMASAAGEEGDRKAVDDDQMSIDDEVNFSGRLDEASEGSNDQ